MADYLPQASGLWSTTTWITAFSNLTAFAGGNTPPTIIDDVYADGKTITVDINTGVRSIRTTTTPRTGGLAGGGFRINDSISLSANCLAGTTTCLTFPSAAPNTCTVVGNISGGSTASVNACDNSSTGTMNIIGTIRGGTATSTVGIRNTGSVFITGDVLGGTGQTSYGLSNATPGTVTVVGSAVGGNGRTSTAIFNNSIGNVLVVGNVRGGGPLESGGANNSSVGILNNSTGQITVIGRVIATGSPTAFNQHGIQTNSTGNTIVSGSIEGGTGESSGIFQNGGNAAVDVVGNVIGGTTTNNDGIRVLAGTVTVNVIGNLSTIGTGVAISNTTANSTVSVTGNIINGGGIFISNSTATITGNVSGGSAIVGITNSGATSRIVVNGDVRGGIGAFAGVANTSTGVVLINGSVVGGAGGAGVTNTSTGIVLINGSAIGGVGGAGGTNTSTGLLCATKAVGNGWGLGSAGIGAIQFGITNTQNGRAYVEQVEFGPRGATPISGPVYILPSNRNTLTGYTTALGNTVTFYNSLSVNGLLPPVSSVRLGTVYNVGNSTGTIAVPSASAVQFGVPVDNTTGTAALQPQDVWGYARLSATQVNSMGDRLRNTATTQSIGYQIASFNL